MDSEISSLFGPGEGGGREGSRLQNLHLMSPLEYAAMLKQYTEPSLGVLGQVAPTSFSFDVPFLDALASLLFKSVSE